MHQTLNLILGENLVKNIFSNLCFSFGAFTLQSRAGHPLHLWSTCQPLHLWWTFHPLHLWISFLPLAGGFLRLLVAMEPPKMTFG